MLLPRETARLDGLEIHARYEPAQRVGGDLYDFFPLSDRRLGIVVADVAGKGIAASLLMAICRTNLRQIAPRHTSPAQALVELNGVLSTDIQAGLYVTALYAIVDTAAGDVTIARAGHELPLIARRDRNNGVASVGCISSEGMALGMVGDDVFSAALVEHREPFGAGDALILYTDGVTEAPNEDGKEFSGARMADVIRMLHGRPARDINEGILESVQRFAGDTPQRDDFTLVTVKRV
jgi:sigma-B regulation protein RsbU (phosphoserine phosphatase)